MHTGSLSSGQPCTECGHRMAIRDWSYVYGHRSRGINPRTLEEDLRPLGTDEVLLCRSCEWAVLRARLLEVLGQHPVQALSALAGVAGFITGARRLQAGPAWAVLAVIAFWVAFDWARRRRKPMCKVISSTSGARTSPPAMGSIQRSSSPTSMSPPDTGRAQPLVAAR